MLKETEILNAYKLGLQDGIVEDENCFYIPVRVTGVGDTIRIDESGNPYVEERLKAEYFTPEVLAACSRLPITLEHPEGQLLSPKTIDTAKIIGLTLHAYIKDEEIWAIAKVFDKSIIKLFGKEICSTSPGISCFYVIITNDGKIKEAPAEINHLAFVSRGHWDQKAGSVGFDNTSYERIDEMAEEIKLNDIVEPITTQKVKVDLEINPKVLAVRPDEEDKPADVKADEEDKPADVKADEEPADVKADALTENVEGNEGGIPVVDDEDVEILDDEVGTEHHSQPAVDEEVEIVDSEDEEELDEERNELLAEMRDVCDKAHPSLCVKMPHISQRETPRSVVSKFMRRNPSFVDARYSRLKLDSMSEELARAVFNSMKSSIECKSSSLGAGTKKFGFVQTAKGYAVDSNF